MRFYLGSNAAGRVCGIAWMANFSYGGRTVGLKFPHDTDNASALSAGQPDSAIVLDSAAQKRNATEKGSEGWQTRPLKGLEV